MQNIEIMEEEELKINYIVLRMQKKIHAAASAFYQADICSLSYGFQSSTQEAMLYFLFLL